MTEIKRIFKRKNVIEILKSYINAHILGHVLVITLLEGTSKKSLEIVRESAYNRIVTKLRKKYSGFIDDYRKEQKLIQDEEKAEERRIWFCWLQGLDDAPEIVRKCYESITREIKNREVVLLTEKNIYDWVKFPDYITDKINRGVITKTHLTDLLRLELLENYGGTWIDATVYCSGGKIPGFYLDSDLFMYQILKPGLDGHAQRVSSWFITARAKHPIICLVRALLYEYWKKNEALIDYFLIHDFFELAIETYPNEWDKVIPVSSGLPHVLLLRLDKEYDDVLWNEINKMSPFHKLSWKITEEQFNKMNYKGSYYNTLLDG